jgi:hypothetical protein
VRYSVPTVGIACAETRRDNADGCGRLVPSTSMTADALAKGEARPCNPGAVLLVQVRRTPYIERSTCCSTWAACRLHPGRLRRTVADANVDVHDHREPLRRLKHLLARSGRTFPQHPFRRVAFIILFFGTYPKSCLPAPSSPNHCPSPPAHFDMACLHASSLSIPKTLWYLVPSFRAMHMAGAAVSVGSGQ